MKCNNCGSRMEKGERFCRVCGSAAGKAAKSGAGIAENTNIKERSGVSTDLSGVDAWNSTVDGIDTELTMQPKKSAKKLIIAVCAAVLLMAAGVGGYLVKSSTDAFKAYIQEFEAKAAAYTSLGSYDDEYRSLLDTAYAKADKYSFFSFNRQKAAMNELLENVEALKQRIDKHKSTYNSAMDEAEVNNKLLLDTYEPEYLRLKEDFNTAAENMNEEEAQDCAQKLTTLVEEIKQHNIEKTQNYVSDVEKANASDDYYSAEKEFIKTAKSELKSALSSHDYIKADEIYNEFNKQKKAYDSIPKSTYFKEFAQMDVSDANTIKLYYYDDDDNWSADKFSVLEKKKASETWVQAEVSGVRSIEDRLSIDLVADISGSMGGVFYDMQESVRSFVNSTGSGTRLGLSIISDVYRRENKFTTDKQSIIDSVNNLHCYGLTSLYQSLYSSVVYTATEKGARCVVAFTDGINEPYGVGYDFDYDDVVRVAQKYKIPIYIISIGDYVESGILSYISANTGGKYYEGISAYDLDDVYSEIYAMQRRMYEISYKSTLNNDESRDVYINYYDEGEGQGLRSQFSIEPEMILSAYSTSRIIDSTKPVTYYTDKKYISAEDLAELGSISDLQTLINIYCAKAGYKFPEGGEALAQMKNMGVISQNGNKNMAEVTKTLRKNEVVWANFNTLFNYRYEYIYGVASGIYYEYYEYDGETPDLDELDELVHESLGEKKSRFLFDVTRAYDVLSYNYF